MKALIIILTLFTGFSASAQITTTEQADGTKSPSYTFALGKTKNTVTSQVKFVYPDGLKPEPFIYKKGGNKKNYIQVANETVGKMSKFEIDIFTGNKNLSKSTLLVWLSAKSPNRAYLSSGTYKYSAKNPAEREEYDFSGTVRLGDKDMPISDGWFSVNSFDKRMILKYEFTLTNGVKTVGEYNLAFQTVDRSK